MRNPRFLALTTLEKVEAGAFIQEAFDPKGLKDVDRNLAETIVYGTVQNKLFLDHVIDRFVKKPENLDQNIRQLLRMALYQMHFLDRVPDHAVVSETVKMAKVISNVGAAGLVNGVLRQVIRQKEDAFHIRGEDEVTRLSVTYSFPKEWVVYFQQLLKDETEDFLKSTFKPAPLTLRPVSVDLASLMAELEEAGFHCDAMKSFPAAVVKKPRGLFETSAYKEGRFYVQDAASQEVVGLFTPDKDAEAMDLCAAPGGKSFQMAELFSHVDAFDSSPERLMRMEENIRRLGYKNIATAVRDGKMPLPKKKYDRILVDAPCTGLGLIRRKPEIKYRVGREDVLQLARVQRRLLENAYGALNDGGELVYSTCSVTVEENEGVLHSFLTDHPECRLKEKGTRYWPHRHGTDGFTMACIVRKDA
ncbi:16S rRNA (cytosine(967)-C(5))-methyltransferase RsmB [Peptoniphilus sp. EMRHCC_23]|uniref:16S rRNA (cytosine(967)-C(5))-methyltransferase RsmB n=1 Tax=Peptoniphilus rachelemmaiella TaxID=2811779 RepID=UPI001C006D7A|nr:16S rRNA (cytosine(967)-C(5))-methyltransferase RsmB [Peptoniphilus rachelemmaiella]